MANKYANQIYEAIDILTDQKLRNLKLDCTVQAIVKDNTNADKGYYTIEIQDANQNQQIIARSNRIDYVYPLNSCVYVTIPQNNSALDKWILGSVEVETSELDAYYLEEERPVQSGAGSAFDGALALAQLIGGGDMLIIDFKVKDSEASGDGDGKLSFKGALKVGDTELVPVELNEDNIEGDPYFVDDTQRFTYKIPAHEYEITDIISFEATSAIDIEIDKIYIGKSDNEPFTKLLTAKLLNVPEQSTIEPEPQEKIVFNFAADAIQRLQLQAYYNGVAIENNVTYLWAFDDTTMNHVILGSVTGKNATFSRNELWRNGTFNFTAAITYDGERIPIASSVSSINFPIVSISQSTAGETTTLTANLMVGSEIRHRPWGGRTVLTYLWNDGSTTPFITRPKLKSGDSQNYTCTVKQQGIEIGSGNSVVIPQPEAAAQGVIAITNGNALLVWDESNTFKNDEIVLSATIYDVNGKEVCSTADDGTEKPVTGDNGWLQSITWTVHANDLYKVKDNTETDDPTLTIVAKGDFNLDVEVPQIEVTLTIKEDKFHQYYPDRELKDYTNLYAITEFTATQQGMPGTNGSKYIVKPLVDYATVTQDHVDFSVKCKTPVVNFAGGSDVGYYLELKYQLFANDISKQYLLSKYDTLYFYLEDNSALDQFYDGSISLTEALFNSEQTLYTSIKYDEILWDPTETNYLENVSITIKLKSSIDSSIDVDFDRGEVYQYNLQINGDTKGSYDISNYTSSGSGYIENWTWNDSYSIQEYGFLAAAAPYIRVKPRVWDVELKQWLPEEGLSYSTQLMYTRNPEGISKVVNTNEYHLTVTSVDFNTTNIIRLTVMLDGKKFTTYLPLVIGTEETTKEKFAECLDHPFFYVMYDSTSTVPFYRYKQNAQSLWIKSNCNYEIAFNYDLAPKYLTSSSGVLGVKVNDQKIFTNDGENENFVLTSLTSAFYVPILFANVTSLYDFVGEWDGESAKIGDDYVISPIAAFGGKNENNKFTGLVLGAVNDSHTSYEKEFKGMIGYYQNQRTFELNATNGMAKFGRSGKGQIIIDPSQDEALIYGGNYNVDDLKSAIKIKATYDSSTSYILSLDEDSINFKTENIGGGQIDFTLFEGSPLQTLDINDDQIYNQSWDEEFDDDTSTLAPEQSVIVIIKNISNIVSAEGMLINLTKPSIEWGNENFSVDKDGKLNTINGYFKNGYFEGEIHANTGELENINIINGNVSVSDASGTFFQINSNGVQIFRKATVGLLTVTNESLYTENYGLYFSNSTLELNNGAVKFSAIDSNNTSILAQTGTLKFGLSNSYLKFSTESSISGIEYPTYYLTVQGKRERSYHVSWSATISGHLSSTNNKPSSSVAWHVVEYNKLTQVSTYSALEPYIDTYWGNTGSSHTLSLPNIQGINNTYNFSANYVHSDFAYNARANNRLIFWIGDKQNIAGINNYRLRHLIFAINQLSETKGSIIDAPGTNATSTDYMQVYVTPEVDSNGFAQGTTNTWKTMLSNGIMTSDTYQIGMNYTAIDPSQTGTIWFHTSLTPDGSWNIGTATNKWNHLYASNINGAAASNTTSDRNLKNTIAPLTSQYLSLIDKLTPVSYKYNDGSSGRIHTGMIAQDVEDAMAEVGLTSQDFAGLVIREMGTENQTYALRYEEFIAPMIGKIQQQDKEISDLKSEIQELKTLISQLRGQEG